MHSALTAKPDPCANGTRWSLVTARDLMRRPLITIDRHASVAEAARILSGSGISGAPVTDSRDRIVGVVSFRDLVERLLDEPLARAPRVPEPQPTGLGENDQDDVPDGPEREEDLVEDVMTSEIRSVSADASLPEIAATMKRHSVHRVLVEDGGQYVGLIGTFEVLDVLFP